MGLHWPGSRAVLRHVARGSSVSRTTQPGQSWAWRCPGTRAGPPPHLGAGPPPWFRDAPSELHRFQMREGASPCLTPPTWLSARPSPQLHPAPSVDPPAQLGPRSAGGGLGEAGGSRQHSGREPSWKALLTAGARLPATVAPACSLPPCVPSVLWGSGSPPWTHPPAFEGELGGGKAVHADHQKVLSVAEETTWTLPERAGLPWSQQARVPRAGRLARPPVRAVEPRRGVESRLGPPTSAGPLAHYLSCPVLVLLANEGEASH